MTDPALKAKLLEAVRRGFEIEGEKITDLTILHTFKVLWEGWELDYTGWIVEIPDGSRFALMTNHGSLYLSTVQELKDKIAEYEQAIMSTKYALQLLENKG